MCASFVAHVRGPVLTLVFRDTASQYESLARIETFYESEKHAGKYMTWDDARRERVCKGYEAFNFPLRTVSEWLTCMQESVCEGEKVLTVDDKEATGEESPFWVTQCSSEEQALLAYLMDAGVLDKHGTLAPTSARTYVISAVITCIDTALAHERLHALYFFSPTYRALLKSLWEGMPKPIATAVESDLKMRGYASSVWLDELGAYLGVRLCAKSRRDDPVNEFGNKSAPTCAEIRHVLLQQIPRCWKSDVGVEECDVTISSQDVEGARRIFAAQPSPQPLAQARSRAQRRSRSKK